MTTAASSTDATASVPATRAERRRAAARAQAAETSAQSASVESPSSDAPIVDEVVLGLLAFAAPVVQAAASDADTDDDASSEQSRRAVRLASAVVAHAVAPAIALANDAEPLSDEDDALAREAAADDEAAVDDESAQDDESDREAAQPQTSPSAGPATGAFAFEASQISEDADADAFDRAVRALNFTAEHAVPRVSVPRRETPIDPEAGIPVAPPRRRGRGRRISAQRVVAATFSVGVMGVAGLLAFSMATPVGALAIATNQTAPMSLQAQAESTKPAEEEIQAFVASPVDTDLGRDETYQAATFQQMAADTGITKHSDFFTNNPNADIQWPFAVGVPVTDTWGPRWGSFHHGVDFTPGEGADIQSIAEGTVRIATESGGLYGVYVVVDHEIDGHKVSSLYAHMLHGSLKVAVGDKVSVGTILGNTGDTGLSYGPHTHFEITVDGTRIDPLPWLRTNAGG